MCREMRFSMRSCEVEPGLKKENPDRYGADQTGEDRYGITSYKYYITSAT